MYYNGWNEHTRAQQSAMGEKYSQSDILGAIFANFF